MGLYAVYLGCKEVAKFAPGILTGTSGQAIILMSLFEPETSNVRTEPPKGGFVFLAGPVTTVR